VEKEQLLQHSKIWDRTGIVVATLCMFHCLLFPAFVLAVPTTKSVFGSPLLEGSVLFLGILVGSISFTTAYRKHRLVQPMMVGLTGVAILALRLFVFPEEEGVEEVLSLAALNPFVVTGGSLLILGHYLNLRACHCYCDHDCPHEEHHAH
jgi:hypothetical protein